MPLSVSTHFRETIILQLFSLAFSILPSCWNINCLCHTTCSGFPRAACFVSYGEAYDLLSNFVVKINWESSLCGFRESTLKSKMAWDGPIFYLQQKVLLNQMCESTFKGSIACVKRTSVISILLLFKPFYIYIPIHMTSIHLGCFPPHLALTVVLKCTSHMIYMASILLACVDSVVDLFTLVMGQVLRCCDHSMETVFIKQIQSLEATSATGATWVHLAEGDRLPPLPWGYKKEMGKKAWAEKELFPVWNVLKGKRNEDHTNIPSLLNPSLHSTLQVF